MLTSVFVINLILKINLSTTFKIPCIEATLPQHVFPIDTLSYLLSLSSTHAKLKISVFKPTY